MRKRVVLGAMALMLISSAGCSSVPKEKEIKEDLENYSEKNFLSDGEVIDEVKIEDRDTNKKEKYDNVLCTVVTEKNNISYEKEVNLTYQKYEKDWELKDLSVNDSDAWVVKPLKGIAEKDIPSTLVAEKVDVEGETWNIEDGEVKKISIKKQETDLKEKTDKITMEIVLDSGVEQATGTVVAEYEFEKEWKLDSVSEKGKFKTKPKMAERNRNSMIAQFIGIQHINFQNDNNETIAGDNAFFIFKTEDVQGMCAKKWFLKEGVLPKDLKVNDKVEISFNFKGKVEKIAKVN